MTNRSAMGKSVDMASLIAKNEKVRAVGNMNVNARGDTIDSHGRVIKPVTEKVTNNYSKTVGNRSAQNNKNMNPQVKQPNQSVQKIEIDEVEPINAIEAELEKDLEDDIEIENIKAKEQEKNARN